MKIYHILAKICCIDGVEGWVFYFSILLSFAKKEVRDYDFSGCQLEIVILILKSDRLNQSESMHMVATKGQLTMADFGRSNGVKREAYCRSPLVRRSHHRSHRHRHSANWLAHNGDCCDTGSHLQPGVKVTFSPALSTNIQYQISYRMLIKWPKTLLQEP